MRSALVVLSAFFLSHWAMAQARETGVPVKLGSTINTIAGPAAVEGKSGSVHTIFEEDSTTVFKYAVTVVNHGEVDIVIEHWHNKDKEGKSDSILPGSSTSLFLDTNRANKLRVICGDSPKSGMARFTWRIDIVPAERK